MHFPSKLRVYLGAFFLLAGLAPANCRIAMGMADPVGDFSPGSLGDDPEKTAMERIRDLKGRYKLQSNPKDEQSPSIVKLDLANSGATDQDMLWISALSRLQDLDLSGTRVTDTGVAQLATHKHISSLRIGDTKISDTAIRKLGESREHLRVYRRPPALRYFPEGVWKDEDQESDEWLCGAIADELFGLNEPSLLTHAALTEPKTTVYRLLWRTARYDFPVSIRIVEDNDGVTLTSSKHDATFKRAPGHPPIVQQIKWTSDQWKDFQRIIREAKFWSMPSTLETQGVSTEYAFVLEGIQDGKYRVTQATWRPKSDKAYAGFVRISRFMITQSYPDLLDYFARQTRWQAEK